MKRSATKKMKIEHKILRHMRLNKGLSMRKAGAIFGLSCSTINHLEHGRMNLPESRIPQIVEGYGYTMTDFEKLRSGEEKVPIHLRDEYINIIEHMDHKQLQGVYGRIASNIVSARSIASILSFKLVASKSFSYFQKIKKALLNTYRLSKNTRK